MNRHHATREIDGKSGDPAREKDTGLQPHREFMVSRAWWITAAYGVFATLWIILSDWALSPLVHEPESLITWSVYKGLAFVLVTSFLLLVLMRGAFGRIETNYRILKAHEGEIERLQRLYSALSHINQAIVKTTAREELLSIICRVLVEEGGFIVAWIGWNDPESHRLVPVTQWGDSSGYIKNIQVYSDERPEGQGPCGRAFRTVRPYICNDLFNDPVTLPWREEARRRGFHASAAFPIRQGDKVVGTLSVYAKQAGFFKDKEIALLEEVAEDLSFALDNLFREEERRRVEELARNERKFSDTMIDSMPGILYFYTEEGRFLRWNQNFINVAGYPGEEIARMHPLDFFVKEDKSLLERVIAEVFEKGEAFLEAPFRTKGGTTIPFFFTGKRVIFNGERCLIGMGIDVSERKLAEEERSASEARYRTLFEYAPDGILIADPEGNYIDANASICRMLGYTRQELEEFRSEDIVDRHEIRHINPALETINSAVDHHREWQFRCKDGSVFPAEVLATRMPDGNLLAMIRDVTERQAAERAMRELNEQLETKVAERTAELETALVRAEAADRLKSAFLATMSHELRTPLNSIIGFTGIILQGLAGPLNPEQSKQLGMVRGSARHLLDLINDVLDISKIEADQLEIRCEPFDLPTSLKVAVETIRPMAQEKQLKLCVEVHPALGEMTGDRRRVEQILINLLNNAVKFTEHGSVTVQAEPVSTMGETPEATPRPAVRICVSDTGIGIKPEDLASLFQPFRQLDSGLSRQHEGTGLGLAICRRLARLLDGEISAASIYGKGSSFTAILPLQQQPAL